MALGHGQVFIPMHHFVRFGRKAVERDMFTDCPSRDMKRSTDCRELRPLRDEQRKLERLLLARDLLSGLEMRARFQRPPKPYAQRTDCGDGGLSATNSAAIASPILLTRPPFVGRPTFFSDTAARRLRPPAPSGAARRVRRVGRRPRRGRRPFAPSRKRRPATIHAYLSECGSPWSWSRTDRPRQ